MPAASVADPLEAAFRDARRGHALAAIEPVGRWGALLFVGFAALNLALQPRGHAEIYAAVNVATAALYLGAALLARRGRIRARWSNAVVLVGALLGLANNLTAIAFEPSAGDLPLLVLVPLVASSLLLSWPAVALALLGMAPGLWLLRAPAAETIGLVSLAFLVLGVVGAAVLTQAARQRSLRALVRERARREELLALQNDLGEGLVVVEAGRPVLANEAFADLAGYTLDELYAVRDASTLATADGEALGRAALAQGRRTARFDCFVRRKDGREVPVEIAAKVSEDGRRVAFLVRDATRRKRDEAATRARLAQQAVLARLAREAVAAEDLDAFLRRAARLAAEAVGADLAKIARHEPARGCLGVRAQHGWSDGARDLPDDALSSLAGYTLQLNAPVLVTDSAEEARFLVSEALASRKTRSAVAAPIAGRERAWGVLECFAAAPGSFRQHDAHFVETVACLIASVAERLERAPAQRSSAAERSAAT